MYRALEVKPSGYLPYTSKSNTSCAILGSMLDNFNPILTSIWLSNQFINPQRCDVCEFKRLPANPHTDLSFYTCVVLWTPVNVVLNECSDYSVLDYFIHCTHPSLTVTLTCLPKPDICFSVSISGWVHHMHQPFQQHISCGITWNVLAIPQLTAITFVKGANKNMQHAHLYLFNQVVINWMMLS